VKKIPSSVISSPNVCVGKLLNHLTSDDGNKNSRGPYKILTPAQKFDIGKRAAEIGTTATMRYYDKNYPDLELKKTSMRLFEKQLPNSP